MNVVWASVLKTVFTSFLAVAVPIYMANPDAVWVNPKSFLWAVVAAAAQSFFNLFKTPPVTPPVTK